LEDLAKARQLFSYGCLLSKGYTTLGALYATTDFKIDPAVKLAMKKNYKQLSAPSQKRRLNINSLEDKVKKLLEKEVFDTFMDAVYKNDGQKIIEIADAVSFFKGYRGFKSADPVRGGILTISQHRFAGVRAQAGQGGNRVAVRRGG
jgi:hypothetical protein